MLIRLNRRLRESREEGSGMIFALVVLMVALMLTMLFGAFALTNLQTTKNASSLSTFTQGIDSALSNALSVANSNPSTDLLASHIGVSNAVTGSLTATRSSYGSKWRWYTERVAVEGQPVSYYIYATAYSNTPSEDGAKTQRALLVPKIVSAANITTGGAIEYTSADTGSFQWGFFGYNQLKIPGTVTGTYDSSRIPTFPATLDKTGTQVASAGTITLTNTQGVSTFNKFGPGGTSRCVGDATCTALETISQPYVANLGGVTVRVNLECPNTASSYPDYRASTSPYIVPGCYNNVYFDADEELPAFASTNSPAKMYVKGNIIVSPNVRINNDGKAPALQIYSQAGTTAEFQAGTTGITFFNGMIAGNALTCSGTGTGTVLNIRIYGALACNKIIFDSNAVLAQDKESFSITSSTDRNIWSYVKYENLY